jgi:tetratricopeptide (TPR) repeat protein
MKKQGKTAKAAATDAVVERATAALMQGRADQAERMLRDLLAKGTRSAAALHELGRALLQQRRPGEAIAPFEEAARLCPDPAYETNLALALTQSGRSDEAIPRLERAIAWQPPFPPAFYEFGTILYSQQRLDEAETVLKRGLEVAPTRAELSLLLGGIYLRRCDWDNAKVAFARALVNQPGNPVALHGFGAALLEQGEFVRAAERFRQALAKDPTDFQSWLSLGTCQLELGLRDEGLASLRAAAQTNQQAYWSALRIMVTSAHGRFWLRPSAAAALLRPAAAA